MNEKRESFGSRLGFILVSAGCAIGIGNVWKFPYVAGQNGGGVFVLFYLLFLVVMGIPVMTMELALGRRSGLTMVKGYKKLEKPGQKVASSWMGLPCRLLYFNDVLHYSFRLDDGLFCQICNRKVHK